MKFLKNAIVICLCFQLQMYAAEEEVADENKRSTVCFRELLTSYGLRGLNDPIPIIMEMCPNIHQSCCSKRDQLLIYQNWVTSKERKKVKRRYYKMTGIYTNFLEELREVYSYAEGIIKKLKYKKIANCKELAKRVTSFKITMIEKRILENVKKLEEFLYESYKGFYCTICNYENHKFFNKGK